MATMMIAVVGTYRSYDQHLRENKHLVGYTRHVANERDCYGISWTDVHYLHDAYAILKEYPNLPELLTAMIFRRFPA